MDADADDDDFRCIFDPSSTLRAAVAAGGAGSWTSEAALLDRMELELRELDERRLSVHQTMAAAASAPAPLSIRLQRSLERSRHQAMRAARRLHRLFMQRKALRESRERQQQRLPVNDERCWLLYHELAALTPLLHSACTASLRLQQQRSQRRNQWATDSQRGVVTSPDSQPRSTAASSSVSPTSTITPRTPSSASSSPQPRPHRHPHHQQRPSPSPACRASERRDSGDEASGVEDAEEDDEVDRPTAPSAERFDRLHLWLDDAKRTLQQSRAQDEEAEEEALRLKEGHAAAAASTSNASSAASPSPYSCHVNLRALGLSIAGATIGALIASAAAHITAHRITQTPPNSITSATAAQPRLCL